MKEVFAVSTRSYRPYNFRLCTLTQEEVVSGSLINPDRGPGIQREIVECVAGAGGSKSGRGRVQTTDQELGSGKAGGSGTGVGLRYGAFTRSL